MKNYVSNGHTVTVAAPYALTSGAGALVGSMFGVAMSDAANGATVVLQMTGEVVLAKATGAAWTVGAKLYWSDSNKNVTTTATSNTLIGVCTLAAASGDTTGRVRLNGSF